MRNYGRIVQDMLAYACTVEDNREREALEVYIAQCMRQRNLVWNKDQESGFQRVREDIIQLSGGKLPCSSPAFEALFSQPKAQQGSNKKKHK